VSNVNHERVREALAALDRLVAEHPELQSAQARARLTQWMEDSMIMAKAKNPGVFIRMTEELIRQVDDYVERLTREHPGMIPTRSDAIRMLVIKGLETAGERPQTEERR
jgi:hypothetical protein